MKWVRVEIQDLSLLKLLDLCPNCLASPAQTEVELVRSTPGVSHRCHWPFCEACASLFTRYHRRKARYVFLPAKLLVLIAVIFAFSGGKNSILQSLFFLLGIGVLTVSGTLIVNLIQRFSDLPAGAISHFPTVSPRRGGPVVLSGRVFGQYYFLHPLYVESLMAANSPENISVNIAKLEKAKTAWQERLSGQVFSEGGEVTGAE